MNGNTPLEPPQEQYKPEVDHTGSSSAYYAYVMTVDRSMEADADLFTGIPIGRFLYLCLVHFDN